MATLTCRIELDKEKGIKLFVEDKKGQITQTVEIDGKAMTFTCKGKKETSKIIQKPDSIKIECKTYTVDAETVTVTSKKAMKHESKDKLDVLSTKDMKLESKAKLTGKATKDMSLSGAGLTAKATKAAQLTGADVTVKASKKATVKASAGATIDGGGKAEVKGAKVDVKATGQLTAKSTGMATFQGNMTMIKGSLIKLG